MGYISCINSRTAAACGVFGSFGVHVFRRLTRAAAGVRDMVQCWEGQGTSS